MIHFYHLILLLNTQFILVFRHFATGFRQKFEKWRWDAFEGVLTYIKYAFIGL